jgi:hypothetical protein
MKTALKKITVCTSHPGLKVMSKALFILGISLLICKYANATDLLDGTTGDMIDTMKGKGKYWAYIVDGVISLGAFAKTKNPLVFFSVLAVAVGMTVIVKMAGG